MPSSYQVVLWKQESFVVLRPLQIEFFRNLLGEAVFAGSNTVGYSRFTTNSSNSGNSGIANGVAWFEGPKTPATGDSCINGSLYTVSSTISSGHTLWGCIAATWDALD
jgi:hypothetical protein